MKNFYDKFYNEMKHNAYFAKMELKKVEVPKNNHMAQTVTVLRPGEAIAPTIYPEQFFQEYMQGTSVTRIVQNLADTMQRNSVKQYASSAEAYLSFIKKENLRAAVVNYENNKEWLKDVPHERLLDLAVFAKVDMGEPGMSMKFNNWLLSRIQMTKEEVLAAAIENTKLSSLFIPATAMIERILIKNGMAAEDAAESAKILTSERGSFPFFILTNDTECDGAAVIASSDVLKKVYEQMGGDYYIVPTSIHEALVFSKESSDVTVAEMQRTLRETNQEDVDLEERLSDEVYEYDGLQLKLAGDNNLERDAEAMEPMPHRHSR